MSSVFEQRVIELVTVTQEELLKKERERLKDKMKSDEVKWEKAQESRRPGGTDNCVTTHSSAMKVDGQR